MSNAYCTLDQKPLNWDWAKFWDWRANTKENVDRTASHIVWSLVSTHIGLTTAGHVLRLPDDFTIYRLVAETDGRSRKRISTCATPSGKRESSTFVQRAGLHDPHPNLCGVGLDKHRFISRTFTYGRIKAMMLIVHSVIFLRLCIGTLQWHAVKTHFQWQSRFSQTNPSMNGIDEGSILIFAASAWTRIDALCRRHLLYSVTMYESFIVWQFLDFIVRLRTST